MSKTTNNDEEKSRLIESGKVSAILLLVYLLAPYAVQVSNTEGMDLVFLALLYTLWCGSLGYFGNPILISPIFLGMIPYSFFRIIFIVMILRLYNENTTKIRSFLVGIIGELQFPVIWFIAFLPSYQRWIEEGFYMYLLPIPILPIIAAIIVLLYPPQKVELWKEESSKESWYDHSYTYDEEPA